MKEKMSILGVGPKLFKITVLYSIALIVVMKCFHFNLRIDSVLPYSFVITLGIVFIVVGLLFLIASAFALVNAYKADQLYVKGAYSVCRHPLYSAWILFIIPGALLLFNSLLLLTIPIVMFVAFKMFIKEEEIYLQDRFGEEYTKYKCSVGLLLPKFWKYTN